MAQQQAPDTAPSQDQPPPLACHMDAIPADRRAEHQQQGEHLFRTVAQEIREEATGYAFQFPASSYSLVTEFIADERLCCPFFDFELHVPPACGDLRLHITGAAGVKDFLQALLSTEP